MAAATATSRMPIGSARFLCRSPASTPMRSRSFSAVVAVVCQDTRSAAWGAPEAPAEMTASSAARRARPEGPAQYAS